MVTIQKKQIIGFHDILTEYTLKPRCAQTFESLLKFLYIIFKIKNIALNELIFNWNAPSKDNSYQQFDIGHHFDKDCPHIWQVFRNCLRWKYQRHFVFDNYIPLADYYQLKIEFFMRNWKSCELSKSNWSFFCFSTHYWFKRITRFVRFGSHGNRVKLIDHFSIFRPYKI